MKMDFEFVGKAIGVVILVLVLLFFLTWGGIVKCNQVPYWCDIYESVMGGPRALIVYGDSGLGDPEHLKTILQDPQGVAAPAVDMLSIERLSLGNLKQYELVIVEKSRKISIDQLEMFMNYAQQGGRLIWIADAGVEKGDDEVQNLADVNELSQFSKNPWARARDNGEDFTPVLFDQFLGLSYIGNYCELVSCAETPFSVGVLKTEPTGNHPLIFGTSPVLNFKISRSRGFSVVKQFANSSNTNIVLSAEFGGNIKTKDNKDLGKSSPIIVTSGMGERVAYYAYPPEYFHEDNNYFGLVKKMYYGMLGK